MGHESLIPNQEICCGICQFFKVVILRTRSSNPIEKLNWIFGRILEYKINKELKQSNIPLFLLILTDCIPYGIRGEEKHSTTPRARGPLKKGKLFLEFTLFLFLFRTPTKVDSKTSHFNYPFKFYLLSFPISSRKVPRLQFSQES